MQDDLGGSSTSLLVYPEQEGGALMAALPNFWNK